MSELENKVDRLDRKLSRSLGELNQKLDRIFLELDRKADKARVGRQDDLISEMFHFMRQRFEQVDQRFEQVDQRFEQVDQRFTDIGEKLESLEHQMLKQSLLFEEFRSDSRAFTEGLRSNRERLEALESKAS